MTQEFAAGISCFIQPKSYSAEEDTACSKDQPRRKLKDWIVWKNKKKNETFVRESFLIGRAVNLFKKVMEVSIFGELKNKIGYTESLIQHGNSHT